MAHHLFILSASSFLICDIRETVVPVLLTLHTFYEYEMQWYFCEPPCKWQQIIYMFTITSSTVKGGTELGSTGIHMWAEVKA